MIAQQLPGDALYRTRRTCYYYVYKSYYDDNHNNLYYN